MAGSVERLFSGRSAPTTSTGPTSAQICEGVVHQIVDAGILFKLPGFDGGTAFFGPAPWQKPTVINPAGGTFTPVTPAVGDRVLVVFAGVFPNNPWVAAWWPA